MSVTIVTWAAGTDEQIAAMLDAAKAGDIDLQQDGGWAVGDVRTITVDSFTDGAGTVHAQQSIDIAVSSFADYNSCGCLMQFDFKDALATGVRINSTATNVGGYGSSEMKTITLPALVNALPDWLKNRLVEFDVLASAGNGSSTIETVTGNKLALRSEVEIFGSVDQSCSGEGSQIPYYETAANIKKKQAGSYDRYWDRSPKKNNSSSFCCTSASGAKDFNNVVDDGGVAPFGCLTGLASPTPPTPTETTYTVTDTELESVADAIREKGGTDSLLEWPTGFVTAIGDISGGGVKIVPWSTGTDSEIAAMLDAAQAGDIDLQQDGNWAVGDVRTITVSSFTAGGNVAVAQQSIDIVISSFADYNSCGCLLQFDFKDCLAEAVRMNSTATNAGGYGGSEMKTTTLPVLVNALPDWLKNRLVEFDVVAGKGNSTQTETVTGNKLALRSDIEIFGVATYSAPGEGSQIAYYQTVSNRIKNIGHGGSANNYWWLRSPGKNANVGFCCVLSTGETYARNANELQGVAPFGCLGGLQSGGGATQEVEPYAENVTTGYVSSDSWVYSGASYNNLNTTVFEVEAGHSYIVMHGSTHDSNSRFRVMFTTTDITQAQSTVGGSDGREIVTVNGIVSTLYENISNDGYICAYVGNQGFDKAYCVDVTNCI